MSEILFWISIYGVCWAPLFPVFFPAFFVGNEEDLHKEIRKLLDAEGVIRNAIGFLLLQLFDASQRWMLFTISLMYLIFYFLKEQS